MGKRPKGDPSGWLCGACKAYYVSKQTLLRHMWKHHQCPYCIMDHNGQRAWPHWRKEINPQEILIMAEGENHEEGGQ